MSTLWFFICCIIDRLRIITASQASVYNVSLIYMARRFSAQQQHGDLFAAGTLAAFASNAHSGFRLRDAVFFINLLSNWCDCFTGCRVLGITNIQAQRYLTTLVDKDWMLQRRGKGRPRYTLKPGGLVGLVRELARHPPEVQFGQFMFKYFFLRSYGLRIQGLRHAMASALSPESAIELEALCRAEVLKLNQERYLEQSIKQLEHRVRSSKEAAQIASSAYANEQLKKIMEKHPYQLSSEKSLEQVLSMFAEPERKWELSIGSTMRAQLLWEPAIKVLRTQLQIVRECR